MTDPHQDRDPIILYPSKRKAIVPQHDEIQTCIIVDKSSDDQACSLAWMDQASVTQHVLSQSNDHDDDPEDLQRFQRVLMGDIPIIPGWSIAGSFRALTTLSGDMWDVRTLNDGRISIIQGDVSGHGTQAALIVAMVKALCSPLTKISDTGLDFMTAMNHALTGVTGGRFVTMASLRIDTDGTTEYVRCGHTPLLHAYADGRVDIHCPKGMAVGMQSTATFMKSIAPMQLMISPGDRVALCTDGFKESMNSQQDEYGDSMLAEIVQHHRADTPARIIEHLFNKSRHFRGGNPSSDDEMVLCIGRDLP